MSIELGTIVADFSTALATKLSAAGTSCSLQSATDDDGVSLPAGTYFFTLDGDGSSKEHIIATLSGVNLTNIKSVSRQGVITTGAVREHRIGASVKITDFGFLASVHSALNGDDGLANLMKYASELTPTDDYHIVYKKWVEDRNGYWTGAVADYATLPIGSVEGEARVTLDDGKIYVWDINETADATIDSIDLGTNVITTLAAHGLSTGDYVYFETTGTLPAGLSTGVGYYVYVDSTTTFHVSASKAGATVDITDAGTGTHTIKKATWTLAGAGGGAGTVYIDTLLGTDADDAPTNTTFSLTSGSFQDDKYLQVFLNGVLQELGASEDYTTSGNNAIIFNTAVADTDKVTLMVVSIDLYNPAWGLVNASILPDTTNTYDIGSDTKRFKDGYFEGNVDIDGTLDIEGAVNLQAGLTVAGSVSFLGSVSGIKKLIEQFTAGEDIDAGEAVYVDYDTSGENLGANDATAYNTGYNPTNTTWYAQTFLTSADAAAITKVGWHTHGSSTSGITWSVSIRETSGGVPTGPDLFGQVATASYQSAPADYEATFDTPIPVQPNTTYALIIRINNTNANTLDANDTGPYADGSMYTSTNSGSSWSIVSGKDLKFETYEIDTIDPYVFLTDATSDNEKANNFIGFANESITSGNEIDIILQGVDDNQTNLQVGKTYYLSDTPGAISVSPGSQSRVVGRAISATKLKIINDF